MQMDGSRQDILAGEVTLLIEHLSRLVHGLGYTERLAPVQWSALRYFARVEGGKRTVSGLAAFSGVNPSSASRTVGLLRDKGLIETFVEPGDQRRQKIELTAEGWQILAMDPLSDLLTVISRLATDDKVALRRLAEALVSGLRGGRMMAELDR